MKKTFNLLFITLLFLSACKSEKPAEEVQNSEYNSFGAQITDENSLTAAKMLDQFKGMKEGDTVALKFSSEIAEVCSKKGCWMKLPLNDSIQTMVRFKDYGFFMPLDSKGKEVIVEGKAFVKMTPVSELRHYAEDAGKSKEEIAKITEPKVEYAFEAHGVLMKK
jgi:hypothetical protein